MPLRTTRRLLTTRTSLFSKAPSYGDVIRVAMGDDLEALIATYLPNIDALLTRTVKSNLSTVRAQAYKI